MYIASVLHILGLFLQILALILPAYLLFENFFGSALFTVFWKLTPLFIQSMYPGDPATNSFAMRANRNIYDCWDTALSYLFLLPIVLAIMVGPWVFLVLKICGIYDFSTGWLTAWFILLALLYLVSGINQYAIEIVKTHPKSNAETIQKLVVSNFKMLTKRSFYHWCRNWIISPLMTLILLSLDALLVLLNGPAWLVKFFYRKFSIADNDTRRHYYIAYGLIAGILGIILTNQH